MQITLGQQYNGVVFPSNANFMFLKKNQSTPRPRPSEHPPVMGGKMSKRLGGIKGCKYKTYFVGLVPGSTDNSETTVDSPVVS